MPLLQKGRFRVNQFTLLTQIISTAISLFSMTTASLRLLKPEGESPIGNPQAALRGKFQVLKQIVRQIDTTSMDLM